VSPKLLSLCGGKKNLNHKATNPNHLENTGEGSNAGCCCCDKPLQSKELGPAFK